MASPSLTSVGRRYFEPTTGFSPVLGTHRADDIVVVVVSYRDTVTLAVPSGWTRLYSVALGGVFQHLFWKRATSSAEAPTFTWTGSMGESTWNSFTVSGAATSGSPIDAYQTAATTGPSVTVPSVTTTVAEAGVLLMSASDGNYAVTESSWTNANLNPFAVLDQGGPPNPNVGVGVAWGTKATAGATGTTSATLDPALGPSACASAVAFIPSAVTYSAPTVGAGAATTSPATGGTITLPAHSEGDRLVIFGGAQNQDTNIAATTISGFTRTGSVCLGSGDVTMAVWTKEAGASEPNPTVTHGLGNSTFLAVAVGPSEPVGSVWTSTVATTATPNWGSIPSEATVLMCAAGDGNYTWQNTGAFADWGATSLLVQGNGGNAAMGIYEAESVSGEAGAFTVSASPVNPNSSSTFMYAVFGLAANPPDAPLNPESTAQTDTTISLSWDASAGATSYIVERSDDGSTGWTQVGTPAGTTFTDMGLTPETTYFYRIIAVNGDGNSDPSTTVEAATTAAPASGGNRMGGTGAIRRRGGYPR